MDTTVHALLKRLAAIAPLPVPAGEPGVQAPRVPTGAGGGVDATRYVPVLSVYLDWRPEATGERPGVRASRIILADRVRQIERAFWPRGAAYDSVRADAARIEQYLDSEASPSAEGLAIFACAPVGLFETLQAGAPFETTVAAYATPSLYPLARLLDDRETAIVAVVDSSTARLFVSHRGLLRELKGLDEDPKYFHGPKGAVAMNQAHYQRYALTQRRRFAEEVAQRIGALVEDESAAQVILAGNDAATSTLKEALAPQIARITQAIHPHLMMGATRDEVWEEVEPMVREVEAEQDRSVVERLLGEALGGRLGVVGLAETRAALESGQAHTLALMTNTPLSDQNRSDLIALATRTDARVEIVEANDSLAMLGGVGALLRYRVGASPRAYTPPPAPEPPGPQSTV